MSNSSTIVRAFGTTATSCATTASRTAITWNGNGGGDRKMLYLTAERFMYGFVSALKAGSERMTLRYLHWRKNRRVRTELRAAALSLRS